MKEAFKFAFLQTIPIFAGYLFLGISYGVLATSSGLPAYFPILMSIIIYAGAMEFLTLRLLLASFSPVTTFFLTLMVNARHIFYGLAFLDKYKGINWRKMFLIFGLADESFALQTSVDIPEHLDKTWVYFHITWLHQVYWILGAALGALAGQFIPVDLTGIEFVLNSLIIVNVLEQLLRHRKVQPVSIGLISGMVALVLFGQQFFLIPAMLTMIVIFAILFKRQGGDNK